MMNSKVKTLSWRDSFIKRAFDISVSFIGLLISGWLIILAWIIASIDTRGNGLFLQERVGRSGKVFKIAKIKTMHNRSSVGSTVTTVNDSRISRSGAFFRRTKIDELPQLVNVLFGSMSFVGPRPDVPGFADQLSPEDKVILEVRPGITGPATLKYRGEESLLALQADPEKYNREVIFPDKIKLNKTYVMNYSFAKDFSYILKTMLS